MSKDALQTAACAAALLALNAFVCVELFTIEYTRHMGSIEGAYIAIARYAMQDPWELTWFPLWYGGIPFQNTYPPLLHLLVAGLSAGTGLPAASGYHAVTAMMYCLGPVTLFWMSYRLSGERWACFAGAVLYSVVSPAALLMPSVAEDMGTAWGPRRLQALVFWGEGPHVSAMTLLPPAVAALHFALRKRTPLRVYLAAFALAAVVLTNWIAGLALGLALVAYLLAWEGGRLASWAQALAIGGLSYAFASPWIPPSTIADVRRNAQLVVGHYPFQWQQLLYLLGVFVCVVAVYLALRRLAVRKIVVFLTLFFIFMAAQVLLGEWLGVHIFPQPKRYHLEMEMALCLLVAFLGWTLAARANQRFGIAFLAIASGWAVWQCKNYRSYAAELIQPIDIRTTVEYQAATWLDENLPGRRVFVPGSVSFWLNAFSDNPQLGGGFDQGIANPRLPMVIYGLLANENAGETGLRWLRACGVDAIMVGGAGSSEFFKPYHDPEKFNGLLTEAWRVGDDVIYRAHRRSDSLAHVILPENRVKRTPKDALDVEPIEGFVDALENESLPTADFQWLKPHEAQIVAELWSEHDLAVQISHHPGWRAWVNGEPRRILRDALGQMVIDTRCEGRCEVRLVYDGGPEMWLARFASFAAMIGGLIWFWSSRRERRIRSARRR